MNPMTPQPTNVPLAAGTRVRIEKGCQARGLTKGVTCLLVEVTPMGAEYSHCARVVLQPVNGFKAGTRFAFYARHPNRLADNIVRMNDGNPLHTIEVRRA